MAWTRAQWARYYAQKKNKQRAAAVDASDETRVVPLRIRFPLTGEDPPEE